MSPCAKTPDDALCSNFPENLCTSTPMAPASRLLKGISAQPLESAGVHVEVEPVSRRDSMRTVLAKVHDVAAQQDHERVEQVEAVGRGRVDGRADGDAALHQRLDHRHDLRGARLGFSVLREWMVAQMVMPLAAGAWTTGRNLRGARLGFSV